MPSKNTYHHENLRDTLLQAAVDLIGEVGPRAFTLREVARRAGVSHNAPYRHFESKDELLLVVADEGFARLTLTLRESMAEGKTAKERLELCGCGYVRFAIHWPQHFSVMFDHPDIPAKYRETPKQGATAFDVLLECVAAAQKSGDLPPGETKAIALAAWALVHGIAKLSTSGNLPFNERQLMEFTQSAAKNLFPPENRIR